MNIEKLKSVVKYLISHKKTPQVATSMKAFNEARLLVATKARKILESSFELIQSLRKAISVTQIQAVPQHVVCCVSKEKLINRTGVTIIIKQDNSEQKIFCIHSRFVDACYQLFISSHFDLHIKSHFKSWCSDQPWWIPGDYSEKVIQKYISYNNQRNLKLLLIQLNQHT